MSWRPASVRGRLTVWHVAVLTAIVCVFSAGIFVFVRAKLRHDFEADLARELAAVERVDAQDPGDLGELETRLGVTFFRVMQGARIVSASPWTRLCDST